MGPKRTQIPALEPLAAPQNDAERRARQRLHVKRTYYKKLNEMQRQRDRVRQLESEYARLVAATKSTVSPVRTPPTCGPVSPLTDADVTAETNFDRVDAMHVLDDALFSSTPAKPRVARGLPSMRDLYTELAEIKENLLAENEAMRLAIAEHDRFAQKLAGWVHTEQRTDAPVATANASPVHCRAQLRAPVTLAFCQAFARQASEDMGQYRQSRGFVSSGVSVFGWWDRRLPVGDRVRFSLKKLFPGRSAIELSLRGWNVLSMPTALASMFSSTANASFSTVQVIDDDNKILFRLMGSPDGSVLAKTLFMVTRFAIPRGFAVCIKSIDPQRLVPHELPRGVVEKWVEHSTWVTFESAGDDHEHCEIEFSGELQISPLVPQATWLLEILFIILRFEGKITGPVFSLC